jgi:hypothetical protein
LLTAEWPLPNGRVTAREPAASAVNLKNTHGLYCNPRSMMQQRLVPELVTHPIAAKVLTASERRLTQLVAAEVLKAALQGGRHRMALGELITAEDWLKAERSHDARRAQVKRRNDRVRGFTHRPL